MVKKPVKKKAPIKKKPAKVEPVVEEPVVEAPESPVLDDVVEDSPAVGVINNRIEQPYKLVNVNGALYEVYPDGVVHDVALIAVRIRDAASQRRTRELIPKLFQFPLAITARIPFHIDGSATDALVYSAKERHFEFQGIPVVTDDACPDDTMYFLDRSHMSWWLANDPVELGIQTFDYTAELDALPVDKSQLTANMMRAAMIKMQKDLNENLFDRGMPSQIITSKDVFDSFASMIDGD